MRKHEAQVLADRTQETYELFFPAQMKLDTVLNALRGLHSLDKPETFSLANPKLINPVFPIFFEHYADHMGERFFISVPHHMHQRLDALLEEHLDMVIEAIKPEDDPIKQTQWQAAMEIKIHHSWLDSIMGVPAPTQLFKIKDPEGSAATIGAKFKRLVEGERAAMVWGLYPDSPRKPMTPEEKDKLSGHTFHAICRAATVADRPEVLLLDITAGLNHIQSSETHFTKRIDPAISELVRRRAGTSGFPIHLNETELATVTAWKFGQNGVMRAKRIPPTAMHDVPGPGMVNLGVSNSSRARGRIIAMPAQSKGENRHVRILGMSGFGKTNFVIGYTLQKLEQPDMAAIIIDPHGDMAWDLLCRIPGHRAQDVIYFDPLDEGWPRGLNPFQGTDPELMSDHVVSIFAQVYKDNFTAQMRRVLGAAVRTTAYLGLSLYDTEQLLVNESYRREQLRKLDRELHPELFQEWDWITDKHNMVIDSSVVRLKSFLSSPMMRRMLSQREGIDFDWIIREHKVLVVPLPEARMGRSNASAIGQFVQEMAWNAAMKQDPDNRQPSLVVIDEAHHFLEGSMSRADPFSEARKFEQEYVVVYQFTEQIQNKAIKYTLDNNVPTQLSFRTGASDAKVVSELLKPMTPDDMQNLPPRTIAGRIMSSQGPAPTVTFSTFPPAPLTHFEHQIIERTRREHAKPVAEVDAEIMTRHKPPKRSKRPQIERLED